MKILWEFYKTIKTNNTAYRSALFVVLATMFILLLPLLAMQITDEVVWSVSDFVVAGVLLMGTGFTYLLVTSKADNIIYRVAAAVALMTSLLIVWTNLAVGIIGSEHNPLNLMFIAVLGVVIIGSIIARFNPHGMSRTLFLAALTQALVAIIALIAEQGEPSVKPIEIVIVNGFFILLWMASAWLFRKSARQQVAVS